MIFHLENNHLKIAVALKGAELKSVFNKANKRELLWQANPEFWGKSSPVLFPIVGSLKDGIYIYDQKEYKLPRHGFARDYNFEVEQMSDAKLILSFESSNETHKVYPFLFKLQIIYTLKDNGLQVEYNVENLSADKAMYFSLGAHPAFRVGSNADDFASYKLLFNNDSALQTNRLNNGLLTNHQNTIKLNNQKLKLNYKLFENDALVLMNMKSDKITLMNDNDEPVLTFEFENFLYFGLWTVKDSGFICLEPWTGYSDFEKHNHDLETKAGINMLQPKELWSAFWTICIPI